MKILFITSSDLTTKVNNGGVLVSKSNLELLRDLGEVTSVCLSRFSYDNDIPGIVYPATKNKMATLMASVQGYSSYATKGFFEKIVDILETGGYDTVFIDTSNFGRLAKIVKKRFPGILVISFFHNIEKLYALSKVKVEGLHYLPMYLSNSYNEALAVKYSDKLVVLNKRDNKELNKYYSCEAHAVLPLWYKDEYPDIERISLSTSEKRSDKLQLLFLGSYFHANIEGVTWFIENVLDSVNAELVVAGRGMEKLKDTVSETEKLKILGTVDSLLDVYLQADIVIAPIFSGSGIKVKTGEAFRFGKFVVGTSEAFEGYSITDGKEGIICNTADEFTTFLNTYTSHSIFNKASREFYLKELSKEGALKVMEGILSV